MSHQAATSLLSWLPAHSAPAAKNFQLGAAQVPVLTSALNADAAGMYYSGVISLLDAFNGIRSAYFSWATVKLYYSCFYFVRSLLCSNGIGIFYVPVNNNKSAPFSITNQANMSPRLEKGVTHKIVWALFEREFPNNPLLGDIGMERAYKWMTVLRESVNYKNPRFQDPVVPRCFYELDNRGIQNCLQLYIPDNTYSYAFDSDHAVLAFPIECMKRANNSLLGIGFSFDPADHSHVKSCLNAVGLPDNISDELLV